MQSGWKFAECVFLPHSKYCYEYMLPQQTGPCGGNHKVHTLVSTEEFLKTFSRTGEWAEGFAKFINPFRNNAAIRLKAGRGGVGWTRLREINCSNP